MAIVTTDNQYYSDIAAAIRKKLGVSRQYRPDEMAAAIESIGAAQGVPVTFSGNPVTATATVPGRPFAGLKIYGKSTQDGTPSPENPVPIVSAGASGSITLSITDGADQSQSLTISTPNGMPGIPVSSGGNFTDSTGQQWWSDVKDLAAETETRNVLDITFDGSADENWTVQSGTEIGNRFHIIVRPTVAASDLSSISSLNSLLPLGTNGETYRKTYCYTITGGSISQLYISLSGSEDLDGLRAYLQANPMRILARLVEPTTSPLTSEEIAAYKALTSYANTTVISTAEPVAGIEATVYCDAGVTVQRLQGEIQTLSNTNTQLSRTANTLPGAE